MGQNCRGCYHAITKHSGEYDGWDLRDAPKPWPPKREGTGCLVPGCHCRRWFEYPMSKPEQHPKED